MIAKKNLEKIDKIATNLVLKNGIWFSKKKGTVSYPEDGNTIYANIEEASFWFRHRSDCILETVKNFPPNGPIFDIGGGNGFVTLHLQRAGFNGVLIDPNESAILSAQKRGIYNLICARFEDIDFKKKSLPAVGLFDVLEHVMDDSSLLLHLKEHLTQDGRLYITVPAYPFLWSFEDVLAGHFRRYTLHRLLTLLRKNEYEVEYATHLFSILPIPIFLYRTLPYKLSTHEKNLSLERYQKEHSHSVASDLLKIMWNMEKEHIKKRRTIFFGSSCLVVARNNQQTI